MIYQDILDSSIEFVETTRGDILLPEHKKTLLDFSQNVYYKSIMNISSKLDILKNRNEFLEYISNKNEYSNELIQIKNYLDIFSTQEEAKLEFKKISKYITKTY